MEIYCPASAYANFPQAAAYGLAISVLAGGVVTYRFHLFFERRMDEGWGITHHKMRDKRRVHPLVTGTVERTVFALLVAFLSPDQVMLAMGGWLTLKMAAHWNRDLGGNDLRRSALHRAQSSYAILGLLSGFISLAFAGAGGMVARYFLCN